jgi:hypothetical protein
MNWDDFREIVEPLIDRNKKPETTRIQIFELLFNFINIDIRINQWNIYIMKIEKYHQFDRCPWFYEHIEHKLNGRIAEVLFLLMEHEILMDVNSPKEITTFNPLSGSINDGFNQLSREMFKCFHNLEDMITSTMEMINTHRSRPDFGTMDIVLGLTFFNDILIPDLESVLIESIYYKLNNKSHAISKRFSAIN